jgi:HlyD family secretion protein
MKKTMYFFALITTFLFMAAPVEVQAAPQEPPQTAQKKIGALGRLKPSNGIVAVSVPSGYTITAVLVKRGDWVKKGSPLLTMQDATRNRDEVELADLDHKEIINEAEKAVDIKRLEVNIARMEYDHACASLKRLLDGGIDTYSTQQKEDRELQVKISKMKLDAALRDLNSREAGQKTRIAKARKKLELSRKKFGKSNVPAPIDGTILEVVQSAGDQGGAGVALKMADLRTMDAVIEVFESDVLKLSPGLKATVTSKSLPKSLSGRVVSIGQVVSAQSRNSEVIIRLEDPDTAAKLINLEVDVSIEL